MTSDVSVPETTKYLVVKDRQTSLPLTLFLHGVDYIEDGQVLRWHPSRDNQRTDYVEDRQVRLPLEKTKEQRTG